MKMSEAFPSRWMTAADLHEQELTVTIRDVEMSDEVEKGTQKMVLHFAKQPKGMVLNKTNANTIASLYGDDTDDWIDQPITLFPTWVEFQGKQVEALRVKPRKPKPQARPDAAPARSTPARSTPARTAPVAHGDAYEGDDRSGEAPY